MIVYARVDGAVVVVSGSCQVHSSADMAGCSLLADEVVDGRVKVW